MPVRTAHTLLMVSETPWMRSSRQASGTTILNGHRIGRHGVCSEVSPIEKEYQPSFQLTMRNTKIEGKKNTRYEIESISPLVRIDQRSKKKSVRICAPFSSAKAAPSMKMVP